MLSGYNLYISFNELVLMALQQCYTQIVATGFKIIVMGIYKEIFYSDIKLRQKRLQDIVTEDWKN